MQRRLFTVRSVGTMGVVRKSGRCWSWRQALVTLLLAAAYVALIARRPAGQPLVAGTSPAGQAAKLANHAIAQPLGTTGSATQRPPNSASHPAVRLVIRADDPAGPVPGASVTDTDGGGSSGSSSDNGGDSDSDGGDSRCEADRAGDDSAGPPCRESDRHGPAQRVVSYSLFQADGGGGDDSAQNGWDWLLTGLDVNAALSARLYPGWRVRVYHDTAVGSARRSRLAATACRHRHVDLCYVRQPDGDSRGVYRGALWRFFPLSDPLVAVFVSRDLDSRLSQREVTAVQQWLATNSTFHIMRDHWNHLITVPGGLWGARPGQRRQLANKLGGQLNKWLAHPGHKNWDQRALHSVVWWHAAVDSVQHDSYTCQRFPGYTVPFPSRRVENDTTLYLGQVMRAESQLQPETMFKCPSACRPPQHPDWEYC